MTDVLDKIAAGELLGRRQDTATNQLLSHALEQLSHGASGNAILRPGT